MRRLRGSQHLVTRSLVPYRYKSPGLAAVLSTCIPGAGQFYNGHFGKGFFFFFFSWMIIPYFVGIADAYFSARRLTDMNDRFLMQQLLISVEPVSEEGGFDQPPPLPARMQEKPSRQIEYHIDENIMEKARWEKRLLSSGALVGTGALLEISALVFGLGGVVATIGVFPLVLGGVLGTVSWKKYQKVKNREQREEEKRLEKIVVTIARSTGGILSVADLVSKTDLGMAEAEEILNRFVVKGYADISVNDKGLMEYHFLVH